VSVLIMSAIFGEY